MLGQIGIILGLLLIVVLWWLALGSYARSKKIWNGGICAKNGKPWDAVDIEGTIYLFAGGVTEKVRGPMICSDLLDNSRHA